MLVLTFSLSLMTLMSFRKLNYRLNTLHDALGIECYLINIGKR